MTFHCTAVYENGVLRPSQPLALPEGAEVEIEVAHKTPSQSGKAVAEALAAIARLPVEAEDKGFSGSDHDQVLYGEKGAR